VAPLLQLGGTLVIVNLDPQALHGLDRIRSRVRIVYQGFVGFRVKPPKGFGRNVMSEKRLCDLLGRSGFRVDGAIKDPSRSSNIPVEYIRAVKV
jgi:hypothetical protein